MHVFGKIKKLVNDVVQTSGACEISRQYVFDYEIHKMFDYGICL